MGRLRRWLRKCQWKQVKGLCWVHLCWRNNGHCSVLNSFKYLKQADKNNNKKLFKLPVQRLHSNKRNQNKEGVMVSCRNGRAEAAHFRSLTLAWYSEHKLRKSFRVRSWETPQRTSVKIRNKGEHKIRPSFATSRLVSRILANHVAQQAINTRQAPRNHLFRLLKGF